VHCETFVPRLNNSTVCLWYDLTVVTFVARRYKSS